MYSIARYVATTQIKQIASYCLSIDDLVETKQNNAKENKNGLHYKNR
jgi:hypothetical protein